MVRDLLQLTVNPLIFTPDDRFIAGNVNILMDPVATYRQTEMNNYRDRTQTHVNERIAKGFDVPFVQLDGDIGIMSNGAGLAMATMDLVTHYGGRPANFLDLGGSVIHEQIHEMA